MNSHEPVCGVDLVSDERIRGIDADKTKYFHEDELGSGKLPSVFAVKEAAMKACSLDVSWLDVHVAYVDGAPEVTVRGFTGELTCSVSHDDGRTVAVVSGWTC